MAKQPSRREFIQAALAAGTAVGTGAALASPPSSATERLLLPRSSFDKLRLAVIGVAGRGGDNLNGVASQEIVSLCDIDQSRLEPVAKRFPDARTTDDYREAIDTPDLDGVVISTPDHTHALPIVKALRKKLPVYCEKPLTHSIAEARLIDHLTRAGGIVTQMGNQIHSGPNYRRVVEIVKSGAIGPVRRVHVWQGGGVRTGKRVAEGVVPKGINYDMWIGPAPFRPFHESHFHFNWRYWWDFGGGQLADFVCHYMDLPYWALDLRYPTDIQAKGEKGHDGDNECPNRMQVDYRFPARGELPPVHVTWYHGGWMPEGAEQYEKGSAVLFEGEEGRLLADYGTRKAFMNGGADEPKVEPFIKDSIGHHAEWIEAVKGNGQAGSPFEYGVLLTVCGHLGNLSYRLGGREIQWDAANATAVDCPEADPIINRPYREGWSLEE